VGTLTLEEMADKIRANTHEAKREAIRQACVTFIEVEGWTHFTYLFRELAGTYADGISLTT
jgi:hypothetical protein